MFFGFSGILVFRIRIGNYIQSYSLKPLKSYKFAK